MKQKIKKEKLTCPGCKGEIYDSNLKKTIGRKVDLWGKVTILERSDLNHGRYQWACDDCLTSGTAIIANPEAQVYLDSPPYLAYVDELKVCDKCKEEYIFRKEEQEYWYEHLKFWVQSRPKHCAKCRREVRENKNLNNELSTLLKERDKLSIKDLQRLSEIYSALNHPDKAKYYENQANKQKR